MERNLVSERACLVNYRRLQHWDSQTEKSGCEVIFAMTREAFWITVLLSSLGLWAAVWAAAASLASAWLQ
jgi:hypothetical protein